MRRLLEQIRLHGVQAQDQDRLSYELKIHQRPCTTKIEPSRVERIRLYDVVTELPHCRPSSVQNSYSFHVASERHERRRVSERGPGATRHDILARPL